MTNKLKSGMLGLLLVMPSFLLLLFVVIVPICMAIIESLRNDAGGYDFSRYVLLFTDPAMRSNIWFTLQVTIVSVVLVLVISYALAVYLRFGRGWIANWIRRLYMLPLFIPSIIAVYGLINMYRSNGWLARFVRLFSDGPFPKIIYDFDGLILAHLWFNIPFATMLLSSSLAAIPDALIESAKDVGAKQWQVFFRLILPLTYPTMLVTTTFTFMGVIGGFTVPYLIGPNAPQMLGVAMTQIFSVYQDRGLASAVAVFMFLLCSVMGYFYIRTTSSDPIYSRRR